RHSREDVLALLGLPRAIGLTIRVRDRFGDHGLIAVVIGVPDQGPDIPTLRIDTWLMSCRVIGRTVEQFTFRAILDRASRLGYLRIIGEYLPTPKNAPVRELYDSLGFRPMAEVPGRGALYQFEVGGADAPATLVASEGGG